MALQREDRLKGVDERLVRVMRLAASYLPFDLLIVEGLRTQQRQAQLIKAGASRTMNSKHLIGKAVDVAPVVDGELRWDWPLYRIIFQAVDKAAKDLGVKVVWGGNWRTFKDGPHFELAEK